MKKSSVLLERKDERTQQATSLHVVSPTSRRLLAWFPHRQTFPYLILHWLNEGIWLITWQHNYDPMVHCARIGGHCCWFVSANDGPPLSDAGQMAAVYVTTDIMPCVCPKAQTVGFESFCSFFSLSPFNHDQLFLFFFPPAFMAHTIGKRRHKRM